MRTNSIMIVVGLSLIISGCATSVDYSESVSRMEKAINDSTTSIRSIDADLTAKKNAKLKDDIITGKLLLGGADSECAAGTEKCTLILEERKDGKAIFVSSYPLKSSMPKGLKALELLNIYISRLKSITEAKTSAQVTASANATLGSLEGIANQLAKEGGKVSSDKNKVTEYKQPLMSLIDWITHKYVDRIKTEALAKATRDARPVIQDLATFYDTLGQSQKLVNFAGFQTTFIDRQTQYDVSPITANSVDSYVLATSDYDAALKAQAAHPFKAFEIAHENLTKQLNNKGGAKPSLLDVASAIENFEQEVRKIKDLADGFKK